MEPTREIYWNIVAGRVIYLLFALSLFVIAYSLWRRIRLWRLGKPENRWTPFWPRVKSLFLNGLFQGRMFRVRYASIMHITIYSGFIVLTIGTLLIAVQEYFVPHLLFGRFYLTYSLLLDLFGLLALAGVLMECLRRYVLRTEHLANSREDGLVLGLFGAVIVTGFLVEGARMAVTEVQQHPGWAYYSPVGLGIAKALGSADPQKIASAHRVLWWLHAAVSFLFIALFGISKLSHILLAPANIFFRKLSPRGVHAPIDFDDPKVEKFGAETIRDFSWKQLFDLDVCTNCGRCQAVCPAYASELPLSPTSLIQDMKAQLTRVGGKANGGNRSFLSEGGIKEETVWACRFCGACEEICPLFIEHTSKLIEFRRYLVMMETRMPVSCEKLIKSLDDNNHPWKGTQLSRVQWMDGLDLKPLSEAPGREYLLWVGCTGALMERNVKVTRAVANLLRAAGVDVGVLGAEEVCCGEPARRVGHEYMFQTLARRNIETMRGYGVQKVITHCPHCYHVIKNEYPQFGGDFQVFHTTEFFARLIQEGKLVPALSQDRKVSFHDPCYLGRLNEIFQPPRSILEALPGLQLFEMDDNRRNSFCCGGGGGHTWMEEASRTRINRLRLEQALRTGAETIAVSCPFCLQMFEEGIQAEAGRPPATVMDVAELLDIGAVG